MITSPHVVKMWSNIDVHLEIIRDPYIPVSSASSLCSAVSHSHPLLRHCFSPWSFPRLDSLGEGSLLHSSVPGTHGVGTELYFWWGWPTQAFSPIARHWVLHMQFGLAIDDLTLSYMHVHSRAECVHTDQWHADGHLLTRSPIKFSGMFPIVKRMEDPVFKSQHDD